MRYLAIRFPRLYSLTMQTLSMLAVWAAICLLGSLAGCGLAPGGSQVEAAIDQVREQGVSEVQKHNDDVLEVTSALACQPSIGSVGRMKDKVEQFYLLQHCGINVTPPPAPATLTPLNSP